MPTSRVIAIASQKGGVGKTTTAVNLVASLTALEHTVLLVDLDPQGNATTGCGIDKHLLDRTSCDLLLGNHGVEICLRRIPAPSPGFDLVPANGSLTAAEIGLIDTVAKERRLAIALDTVRDRYEFIFIDCPPALNMLTVNALAAADSLLIPMQCEYYAMEGVSSLLDIVENIRNTVNPNLQIDGILRTMHDPRNNLANEVSKQLLTNFANQVYETIIPRNVRLAEAPSYGKPIIIYDKNSRGSVAYLDLAQEVLSRSAQKFPVDPKSIK